MKHKLPMPEVNVKVLGREVDCLWRRLGVILELDGNEFHSDPLRKSSMWKGSSFSKLADTW